MSSRSLTLSSPLTPESRKTQRRLWLARIMAAPMSDLKSISSSGSLIMPTSPTTSKDDGSRSDRPSGSVRSSL